MNSFLWVKPLWGQFELRLANQQQKVRALCSLSIFDFHPTRCFSNAPSSHRTTRCWKLSQILQEVRYTRHAAPGAAPLYGSIVDGPCQQYLTHIGLRWDLDGEGRGRGRPHLIKKVIGEEEEEIEDEKKKQSWKCASEVPRPEKRVSDLNIYFSS